MDSYNNTIIERQVGSGNQLVNALAVLQHDASGFYEGHNTLLESHLLPKQTQAMYPPNGRQKTNTKAVDIATLVTVDSLPGFSNDLFFTIPEEGPVPFIHVYRRSLNGKNYFQGFIKTSESMQDTGKYRMSRLVSSIVDFKSDTRPGGQLDISGQFNAITLPFLPPTFQELDHNQLLKFKDTPADVRTNVPILDGITYRKSLTLENPLLIRSKMAADYTYGTSPAQSDQWWRPNNFSYASTTVTSYNNNDFGAPGVSGLETTSTQPGTSQFTLQDAAVQRLPSLCMYKATYSIEAVANAPPNNSQIYLRLHMRYDNSEYLDIPLGVPSEAGDAGVLADTYVSAYFYAFSTIEKVEVIMSTGAPRAITNQTLTLEACFGSNESIDKQATVVSVRGVPDGVTYSISGRLNYEFVGGSELKPDLNCQPNTTTETDLLAALRVQEYLQDAVAVGQVLAYSEYQAFVGEVNNSVFERTRHSRYAFLGSILPLLRTAMTFIPKIVNVGSAAYNVGRDIHAAMRNSKTKRYAMLSDDLIPKRGNLAKYRETFSPEADDSLPEVENVRNAGKDFQITRNFATITSEGEPEVGELTISSGPINTDSYINMRVENCEVFYQNYDFGEQLVTDEIVDDMMVRKDIPIQQRNQALFSYKIQEPLRTLGWIGKIRKMEKIYLTSSLQEVSGGSIGFTLEAMWYGFSSSYVYTGSSSPFTGWLPSYNLGKGLEPKSKISKIAIKTVQAEINEVSKFGITTPQNYDASEPLPGRVAVESSNWFLEMLLSTSKSKQGHVLPPAQKPEVRIEYQTRVDPALQQEIERLRRENSELRANQNVGSQPYSGEADFFKKPPKQPKVVGPADSRIAKVVQGYPKINIAMEGADEINSYLDALEEERIPRVPDIIRDYAKLYPSENVVSVQQFIDYSDKRFKPKGAAQASNLLQSFKSFVRNKLPMDADANLLTGEDEELTLAQFVDQQGVETKLAGFVTKEEFNSAVALQASDKAYAAGRLDDETYKKAVKKRVGGKPAAKKKQPQKQQSLAKPVIQQIVEQPIQHTQEAFPELSKPSHSKIMNLLSEFGQPRFIKQDDE